MAQYSLVAPLVNVGAAEVLKPVKKLVSYCVEAENNVRNLDEAAHDLRAYVGTVESNIESGQSQGRTTSPEVQRWKTRALVLLSEVDDINIRYTGRRFCLLGYSVVFWSVFNISRDALLKHNDIREHQNNRPNNSQLFLVQISRSEPEVVELYFVDWVLQVARSVARRCGTGDVSRAAFVRAYAFVFPLMYWVVRYFSRSNSAS